MRDAAEYRRNAQECRALAARLDGDARTQLIRMAETWEALAADERRAPPETGQDDPPST